MGVRTRSVRFLATLAAGAAAAVLSVSAPLAQSGGQVVIRVTGPDGQPVVDLRPAELTLRIDGKAREVKGLDLVRPAMSPAPASPAPAAPPVSTLPAPYTTSAAAAALPPGGREFIVAIDDEGIAPGREQPVRDAVKTLVASLSPSDTVGIAGLKSGGVRFAPTANHAAVLEALGKLAALGSGRESESDMACRTRTVLGSVSALLQNASPSRNLVVFSPGIAAPTGETIRTSLGNAADSQAAMCQLHQRDLDELGRVASGSAAAMYVVFMPEAIANASNRTAGEAGLEHLAGVTGADMLRLIGPATAVERIGRTAGTYYLAQLADSTSGARRIDARVGRDGVRVVARPAPATAAEAAPGGKAPNLRDIIRNAPAHRDLPIRSAAFISRQQGSGDLKVVVLLEPGEPDVKLSAAGVGLFNQKGTLSQWNARPEELARPSVTAALTAPAGKYRVRVAAVDASGRAGTTDLDLDVQLTDVGPLKMGTMLLGGNQGGFVPKLLFTPQDAAAVGLFEIYGVKKETKLDVTYELARDESSAPLATGQATIVNGPGEDARIVYGGFGVGPLEPGDYTLRAVINVDGQKAAVASRTLRKVK